MIRPFRPGDIDAVLQLWLAGNLDAHRFVPPAYWTENAPMVRQALLQAEVWVFEQDGALCGFAGLQQEELAGIFVARACRGVGVGKALLTRVKQEHPSLTLHVYRRNPRARAFYEREGFRVAACGVDEATGQAEDTMVWQRDRSE